MIVSLLLFGLFGDCLLSILVGILGSRRRIGFGWAFLISLFLTPIVGLIVALITERLPEDEKRYGCIGNAILILVSIVVILMIFAMLTGTLVLV